MKPYVANLSITPANIIEPLTGASLCALNNHRCIGANGDLMAKAKKNAKNAKP
jgi:hypothetical protein